MNGLQKNAILQFKSAIASDFCIEHVWMRVQQISPQHCSKQAQILMLLIAMGKLHCILHALMWNEECKDSFGAWSKS